MNCGEIAVICGDYRNHIEALLAFTGRDHTWAFFLLDPYGPRGLEYNIVGRIVSPPRHDVMINFPYQDLHKKTGSVRKQTPEHQSHVHYYDLLYGENSWQALAEINDFAADRLEEELVRFYAERLRSQNPELAVKTIPLLFPDRNRTIFYLFLTTHDPTGALKMNEILYGAKQNEYEYRVQWKTDQETKLTRQLSGGLVQQTLFDLPEQKPEPVVPPRFGIEDVAAGIYTCCKGQTKKYRDVMRSVVDSPYFPDEVQKAIKWLKQEKRVEFSDSRLLNETLITFR